MGRNLNFLKYIDNMEEFDVNSYVDETSRRIQLKAPREEEEYFRQEKTRNRHKKKKHFDEKDIYLV